MPMRNGWDIWGGVACPQAFMVSLRKDALEEALNCLLVVLEQAWNGLLVRLAVDLEAEKTRLLLATGVVEDARRVVARRHPAASKRAAMAG